MSKKILVVVLVIFFCFSVFSISHADNSVGIGKSGNGVHVRVNTRKWGLETKTGGRDWYYRYRWSPSKKSRPRSPKNYHHQTTPNYSTLLWQPTSSQDIKNYGLRVGKLMGCYDKQKRLLAVMQVAGVRVSKYPGKVDLGFKVLLVRPEVNFDWTLENKLISPI